MFAYLRSKLIELVIIFVENDCRLTPNQTKIYSCKKKSFIIFLFIYPVELVETMVCPR